MALLEIKNLSKSFNEQIVLNDVSIAFPSTGLVCITGESGCGKSTLIKCIMGIIKFDKGGIYYRGKKIKDFNRFRNESTTYIFQNYSLISFLSPKENIDLNNRKQKKEEIEKYANKVNITHKLNQDIKTLSGGEKQRIAIARALISNAPIILCDEPTGSLDKDNAKEIMELLKDISKDKLVVVVTHNQEHVKTYSDEVYNVQNGTVKQEKKGEKKGGNTKENNRFYLSINNTLKMCLSIFKNQFRKIVFSILSLGLSLSFFLLALNTYSSVNKLIEDNMTSFMNYNFMKLSLIKETKLDNSNFSLVKNVRPERDDLIMLNDLLVDQKIQYDLTPFIPMYPKLYKTPDKKNPIDDIEFVPFCLSMFEEMKEKIDGNKPRSFYEVIVNEEALKIINQKSFYLDLSLSIDYKTENNSVITDSFNKNSRVSVVGICKEFTLIDSPRIYYAYDYLEGISKEIKLDNLSTYLGDDVFLYDRLSKLTYDNDPFVSYCYILEATEINKVMDIYKKINSVSFDGKEFELQNSSLELISSFTSVFDAIYEVIYIFIIITMISSLLLLGLSLDSIVNDNKIDIGIMMCIGILKEDVKLIYLLISLFVGAFSVITSFAFYFVFSRMINATLLNDIALVTIPTKLTIKSVIIGSVLISLISIISSFASFFRIDKMQLGEIMREE